MEGYKSISYSSLPLAIRHYTYYCSKQRLGSGILIRMAATNTRLLSWLVDAVCCGVILLSIYYFLPFRLVETIIEVPPSHLFALVHSSHLFQPSPESWHGPYKFLPNSRWIRLCKLTKAEDGAIYVDLKKFPLDSAPPYRALSYTWGPAHGGFVPHDGDRIDFLMGERNHSVPTNLVYATQQLSDRNLRGYYWIDSLCIDQLNDKERSEQVTIMDKIFQRATAVDVWLGFGYPDTQKINDIVQELVSHQEQEQKWPSRPTWTKGEHLLLPSDWETLVQILSRRWFHRLWTLQEFVLAKEVNILCGNVSIDIAKLLKAAQFLHDHQIPMTLSYGNEKTTITPPVLPMSLLRQVVHGQEILELGFLRCFSDLNASSQIDYETLLVWVYWRSMTKIATDTRDYVFGIAAVANALANRMGLQYEPLKIDYSLTAAETFQLFITRIMEGRFGIRAISIVRRTADFALQHPNNVKTEGLPSWVPDLANRNCFGLSTNGGLGPMEARHVCQNILGKNLAAGRYKSLTVNGSALHVHAHSIGKVQKISPVLPNSSDFPECAVFVISLISLLNQLPQAYQGTNHTPIEALLHTLRFAIDQPSTDYTRKPFNQSDFERYLVQALQIFVWDKLKTPSDQSVKHVISRFTHGPGHGCTPWKMAGLTQDFPMPNVLASRAESHHLCWLLRKDGICEDVEELLRAFDESCTAFRRAFGARVASTKLFILQLDNDNNIDSSQAHQEFPGSNLLLGIGPDSIEGGEEVWAAAGTEWPFILRRHPRQKTYENNGGEEAALTT